MHRRTFLQRVGATLVLPALESLALPLRFPPPRRRLVCIANPFGFMPEFYRPQRAGTDYETTDYLEPLREFRGDMTLFSHFDHSLAAGGHEGVNTYLSGIPPRDAGRFVEGNVSVDQKAAEFVGSATRFSSLHGHVGEWPLPGPLPRVGRTDIYSFTRNGIPRTHFTAAELFARVFRQPGASEKVATRRSIQNKISVLDLDRRRAEELRAQVSIADRSKLDEYLTSLRTLEKDLGDQDRWLDRPQPESPAPLEPNPKGLRPLYDVMFLALQADVTRVATIAFSNFYHGLTHHGNLPEKIAPLREIEKGQIEEYARFLRKLKETDDPLNGGKMLDHTLVVFGAGMNDGKSHSLKNLPLSVAGGPFRHGQHVVAARRTEACNIFLSVLQAFGLEIDRFNLSTGTAEGFERRA